METEDEEKEKEKDEDDKEDKGNENEDKSTKSRIRERRRGREDEEDFTPTIAAYVLEERTNNQEWVNSSAWGAGPATLHSNNSLSLADISRENQYFNASVTL